MNDNAPQQTSTRGTTGISLLGYILGGASFIPLIGVLFGIAAIVVGATSRKKVPAILGACGIVFTLVLYGSLIYFGLYASYGPWAALRRPLAVQIVDTTKGKIVIYQANNSRLPRDLEELQRYYPGDPIFTLDPWSHALIYTPRTDRTFDLRSSGPDGIAGNDDDVLPSR
jgi:hypothetical protein